jgi:glutathione S-transferase
MRPVGALFAKGFDAKFTDPRLADNLEFIENHLASTPWFAGPEISAADIQMSFPMEAARSRELINDGMPNAMAFLDKVHQRPAYQRALEQGGPYAYA